MTKKEVLTMVIDVMKSEEAQFTAEQKEEVIAYATSALEAMAKKAAKAKTTRCRSVPIASSRALKISSSA